MNFLNLIKQIINQTLTSFLQNISNILHHAFHAPTLSFVACLPCYCSSDCSLCWLVKRINTRPLLPLRLLEKSVLVVWDDIHIGGFGGGFGFSFFWLILHLSNPDLSCCRPLCLPHRTRKLFDWFTWTWVYDLELLWWYVLPALLDILHFVLMLIIPFIHKIISCSRCLSDEYRWSYCNFTSYIPFFLWFPIPYAVVLWPLLPTGPCCPTCLYAVPPLCSPYLVQPITILLLY